MSNWLRRVYDRLFAPPCEFKTVLALVASLLGMTSENESYEPARTPATEEQQPAKE